MIMNIRPPRHDGDYPDRDLDCQESIEKAFLAQTTASGAAFVDLYKLRAGIAPDALEAGWSDADLDAAIKELARCYALNVAKIGKDDFEIAAAVNRSLLQL